MISTPKTKVIFSLLLALSFTINQIATSHAVESKAIEGLVKAKGKLSQENKAIVKF